jgi:hypothetical protein
VYIQPNDKHDIVETGDSLGAITSEQKPGYYIEEFVSGERKTTLIGKSFPREAVGRRCSKSGE